MIEKLLECMHDCCNKLTNILFSARIMQKTCEKCSKREVCGGCPNLPMLDSIINNSNAIMGLVHKQRQVGKEINDENSQIFDMFQQLENGKFREDLFLLGKEHQLNITINNHLAADSIISLKLNTETEGIQILNNIFFNAKKANAINMRVVGVDLGNHIALRFIDDGEGMTSEKIACLGLSIASETSTGEGTGILKKLALKTNGSIEWSSAGKGAGTCVTMRVTKHKP